MNSFHIFDAQRRNYVTQNNIIKNKAGIGASQNGVTSLFLHPRPHFLYLQNSDKMQRIIHYVKWAPINGFPEYSIASNGMVKKGKDLCKIIANKTNGYLFCEVRKKVLGVTIRHRYDIHRLVWESFGNTPKIKGYHIHHKDFDFTNNNISNLEYIPKELHYDIHRNRFKKAS